jgi:hypothetical protein
LQNWVATVEAKRDLFALVANYRQGLASQDASDYGVALGYLMVCVVCDGVGFFPFFFSCGDGESLR